MGIVSRFLGLVALLALVSPGGARAAEFELVPTAGWQFGVGVRTTRGDLVLQSRWQAGLAGAIRLSRAWWLETVYLRQDGEYLGRGGEFGVQTSLFDVTVQSAQLGVRLEAEPERPGALFLAAGLGATRYAPRDGRAGETRPAGTFAAGVRYHVSERWGLRLQGALTLTGFGDAPLFCAGGDCFDPVDREIQIQGAVLAGFVVRLGAADPGRGSSGGEGSVRRPPVGYTAGRSSTPRALRGRSPWAPS